MTSDHLEIQTAEAEAGPFVQVRNLTFSYSEEDPHPILRDICLDVAQGEFLAIEGATGSGKTTLCLALNGIIPHSTPGLFKGDVIVAARNTKGSTVPDLARDVGLVYQDPESQLFGLTVEEDVAFGLENIGVPRAEMRQRVAWVLEAVDLAGLENKAPNTLSGGQKQRLAIASVLAMRPRIMVLDEPTAELDPLGKQEILRVVRRLCEEFRLTVVLVEHECEFIAEFADRVALIAEGEVIAQGTAHSFYAYLSDQPQDLVRVPQVSQLATELWHARPPSALGPGTNGLELHTPILLEEERPGWAAVLEERPVLIHPVAHSSRGEIVVHRQAATGPPLLEVVDAFLTYPDGTQALRGVSLAIRPGEFVALIGQNGSGKTTLARLLNGLLRPSAGVVRLEGADTTNRSVAELSRSVGYVFQNPDHQLFAESVDKELRYGLVNHDVPETEHEDRIARALELCGISHLRGEHPLFVSRGERQLIAIASVIAMDSGVIVFDEPTTGLDERYHRLIGELLDSLNAAGRTIVAISHDMRLVAEHAHRTAVLHRGLLLLDASTPDVFDQADLLRQTQISPTQITQLSQRLLTDGITTALSVDQLLAQLVERLGQDQHAYEAAFPTKSLSVRYDRIQTQGGIR